MKRVEFLFSVFGSLCFVFLYFNGMREIAVFGLTAYSIILALLCWLCGIRIKLLKKIAGIPDNEFNNKYKHLTD